MKKFFCLLFVFCSIPFAFGMEVEFGGHHRVRGAYYQQDIEDIFIQRFKFSGAFRPNEMFESNFWLMTNYNWGNTDYTKNEIRIYGYGDWKVSDELMVRVGRTPYQISDGSFMGMNNYSDYPYVMDGVILTYNTESMVIDIWGAHLPKVWDGSEEIQKHSKILGISLDIRSLPLEFKMANLFLIYANGIKGEQIRVGLGLGGDIAKSIDYKLIGSLHGSKINKVINQYVVDAQLGYNLMESRIYIGGHYETEGYDSFYYSSHLRSGILDVAQWGNGTTYSEVGVSYMPNKDFEIGLIGLYFYSVGSWGQWGNQGINPGNSKEINNVDVIEADVYVKKHFAGGFSIELQSGIFDLTNSVPYWQAQLNTQFNF